MKERAQTPGGVGADQLAILVLIWIFILGIISWIVGLLRLSLQLGDIPSASIGISLVAIPVFLLLLGVANYVFWGLPAAAEKEASKRETQIPILGEHHE